MNNVLLLNRNLTFANPSMAVQGWRGEQIGHSQWNPRHGCHTLRLTVKRYNEVAQSLSEACHIAMRRWIPIFEEKELPQPVLEFWEGYENGMDSINHGLNPSTAKPIFQQGFRAAHTIPSFDIGSPVPKSDFLEKNEGIGWQSFRQAAEDLKEAFEKTIRDTGGIVPMPDGSVVLLGADASVEGCQAQAVQSVNSRIGAEEQLKPDDGQNRDGGDQMRKELAEWEAKETLLQNTGEPISTVTHHKTLHRIAKAEGIDLSHAKTQKAMYEAIIEDRGKRLQPAA